jgi:hypothetical protein
MTAAALAFFATASAPTPAHAKACFPYGTVIATAGIAVKNDSAKQLARVNWRVKVRSIATLGTANTDWGIAVERDYHCQKKLGTWRCSAEARPCRS